MDLEVIRRLVIEGRTIGIDAATAQLKQMTAAYEGVAGTSTRTEAATESISRRFQNLESRLDPVSRATRQLAKEMDTLAKAEQQGEVTAQRHAELLTIATANAVKMGEGVAQATAAQKLWAETMSAANLQAQSFASSTGPIGFALSTIGKGGLVAAATIGAIAVAYRTVDAASTHVAEHARELSHFSEATGLTTTQIQALNKEASKFGVSTDELRTGLQRFTAEMENVREGNGKLLESVREVDSGIADQMQRTTDEAAALTLYGQAIDKAENAFQRAQLLRAGAGRGGVSLAPILSGINVDEITAKYSGRGLSEEMIKNLRDTQAAIDEKGSNIQHKLEAIFAGWYLPAKLAFLNYLEDLNSAWKRTQELKANPDPGRVGTNDPLSSSLRMVDDQLSSVTERQKALTDEFERLRGLANDTKFPWATNARSEMEKLGVEIEKNTKELEKLQNTTPSRPVQTGTPPADLSISGVNKAVAGEPKTLQAQIKEYQDLQSAIGALVPIQMQVENEANKLAMALKMAPAEFKPLIEGATQALLAQKQVQADLAAIAPGTYERQLAALNQLIAAYPGLTAAQAETMRGLDQQLILAQAVGGAEKIRAQYQVTFNNLIAQGATLYVAALQAEKEMAVAQAQINSGAKEQLFSLQNAAAGAAAVTGQQKIEAQYQATINQLLREGVNLTLATAVADQERANATAQANAAIDQQIHSLQQQTELIRASVDGTTELVKQRQAYDDAIRSGAGVEQAQRLVAAMQQQVQAQNAVTEAKQRKAILDAQELAAIQRANAAEQQHLAIINQEIAAENSVYQGASLLSQLDFSTGSGADNQGMQGGRTGTVVSGIGQDLLRQQAEARARGAQADITDEDYYLHVRVTETVDSILNRMMGRNTPQDISNYHDQQTQQQAQQQYAQQQQQAAQQQAQQFEMQRLDAQISGNKPGEISAVQGELAFYQAQPRSLENLQQIKSLTDALKQLTTSTEDNTKSQNALSGIYSRQFGQGFYDGGAAVGELIYGLDNNTGSAIDAMQRAANDNTRTQNDLLTNLSQNQIQSSEFYLGGAISATNSVQGAVNSGLSNLTYAVQNIHLTATSPQTSPASSPQSPQSPQPQPYTYPPYSPPLHLGPPGLLGFAKGGSFTTSGYGDDDSNVVAFRVSPQRERVSITPVSGASDGANGATPTINNFNDISITIPANTNEFRASAMHLADEIYNQVAVARMRK